MSEPNPDYIPAPYEAHILQYNKETGNWDYFIDREPPLPPDPNVPRFWFDGLNWVQIVDDKP